MIEPSAEGSLARLTRAATRTSVHEDHQRPPSATPPPYTCAASARPAFGPVPAAAAGAWQLFHPGEA